MTRSRLHQRCLTSPISWLMPLYGLELWSERELGMAAQVFGVYGIGVDQRHLGLIGDYMMHQVSIPCKPQSSAW